MFRSAPHVSSAALLLAFAAGCSAPTDAEEASSADEVKNEGSFETAGGWRHTTVTKFVGRAAALRADGGKPSELVWLADKRGDDKPALHSATFGANAWKTGAPSALSSGTSVGAVSFGAKGDVTVARMTDALAPKVEIAEKKGDTFTTTTLALPLGEDEEAYNLDVARDAKGQAGVAVVTRNVFAGPKARLFVTNGKAPALVAEEKEDVWRVALAYGSDGKAHLFAAMDAGLVHYAPNGGSWKREIVAGSEDGASELAAVSAPNGDISVAFSNKHYEVRVAETKAGAMKASDAIYPFDALSPARAIRLAADAKGGLHLAVAKEDRSETTILLVEKTSEGWSDATPVSAPTFGQVLLYDVRADGGATFVTYGRSTKPTPKVPEPGTLDLIVAAH